jgi:NTP pyrophosphatase (non-canonical NTP hydrolase)
MDFINQSNLDKIEELMLKSDRTIETASLKTVEELGEFISANFGLNSYKKESPEHLQEELTDVLQCVISLYVLVNKKYPFDINKLLEEKNIKWENKYINNK